MSRIASVRMVVVALVCMLLGGCGTFGGVPQDPDDPCYGKRGDELKRCRDAHG